MIDVETSRAEASGLTEMQSITVEVDPQYHQRKQIGLKENKDVEEPGYPGIA